MSGDGGEQLSLWGEPVSPQEESPPEDSPQESSPREDSPPPSTPASSPASEASLILTSGARATETALLDRIDALQRSASPAERLAVPLRVVVPSRLLRQHLLARLVERHGATAGVTVQTLHGVALEILRHRDAPPTGGSLLVDLLVERFGREEPSLAEPLGPLVDGFSSVTATVRDLLDAGFEPALEEAVLEALAGVAARPRRAAAVVRVAAQVHRALELIGLGRGSTLLQCAREELAEDPAVLPSRTVLIHGFAEATGVVADLLEALLRFRTAQLFLDRPPRAGEGGAEEAFGTLLLDRLRPAARLEPLPDETNEPPPVALVAPDPESEVTAVAARLGALLDAGTRPEKVAVVARDLERYRYALRWHLDRRGLPFSGHGAAGSTTPAARSREALLELLARGPRLATDRWLDLLATLPGAPAPFEEARRVELRLALHTLGAGRLEQVARLEPHLWRSRDAVSLPIRQGLGELGTGGEREAALYARRRRLDAQWLEAAVTAARRLCEGLEAWPSEAPLEVYHRHLLELVEGGLGWSAESLSVAPVLDKLVELDQLLPARLEVQRRELLPLLRRLLADVGRVEIGGRGGGVQLLTVTEARGLTFEHLFLVGLNRDLFPRTARPDPLLPDELRRRLRGVLPDLPLAAHGHDEERHLFAQLLSAAPSVTLSWSVATDEGDSLAPSPLLGALLRSGFEPWPVPALFAPSEAGVEADSPPRPASEHAILTGLHGSRQQLRRLLPLATAETAGAEPPEAVATALGHVLDEMDPDLRTREGRRCRARLGPYFGFLGPLAAQDPRHRPLFVTLLEQLAACPWQTLLERLLRVEPTPDPLAELPESSPLLLGQLVHRVLEEIVRRALPAAPSTLDEALARPPVLVPWPTEEELDELLARQARRVLMESGLGLPGLAVPLARRARPMLDAARSVDWHTDLPAPVCGAEVEGAVTLRDLAGRPRTIRFKADRVDRRAGTVVLTDYKTGRPLATHKRLASRQKVFLRSVARGNRLQPVTYHLAARAAQGSDASGAEAVGRFLFLTPDLEVEGREFPVATADSAPFAAAFESAARTVLATWDAGIFFPRLTDPAGNEEPTRCEYCRVAEACLRRDSGARARLVGVAVGDVAEEGGGSASSVFDEAWRLPSATGEEPG